jgi:large conductance mechanosensitive channel
LANDDKMLEELKKIRMLLEPKPAPPAPPAPKGVWNEFKDFLSKYKVLGLAIAFIMGVYLGGLVQSLVKDLLLPAIGLAIPGLGNLASLENSRSRNNVGC